MEKTCQNIQGLMLELMNGSLSAEKTAQLQNHINRCQNCRKFLQALQADDKLLDDFAEAMQPRVARLEEKVIGALNREPSEKPISSVSIWRRIVKSSITKAAAAAVIVIVTAVAIKQVVLQKQQAQSVKRIAQYSKNETVKDSKTPKTGRSVVKSPADTDKSTLAKTNNVRSRRRASLARRVGPDRKKSEAEAKQIQGMVAAGDIDGLIEMLSIGEFPSKVIAAEHLGEIGDEMALPELKRLNEEHGGWFSPRIICGHDSSGAFAVAICKILMWDLPEDEQIEALFDLLEGRGPAVPEGIKKTRAKHNFDVGKRVAAELDKFDDPSIVIRMRKTENKGAAIPAVWIEVRDMDIESAIDRCMEIARDEGGAQRYGAIQCLGKFGDDAIEPLDKLANEGHGDTITVLGYQKENPEVLELICWHLTNNKNSLVRLWAVYQLFGNESGRPGVVPALIQALYDPLKSVRREAAQWLSYAAYYKKTPHIEDLEEAMLIALKHPDEKVRDYASEALGRLGTKRIGDEVPEPPLFHSDLETASRPPLTAEQKLKAKTEPLEKEAAKALKMGPAEQAVKSYKQLLELRPDYELYKKALEKAKAYIEAAETTSEHWYPDAPYIGLRGRYSYLLVQEPNDISTLKEEFELAQLLAGEHFSGWTRAFGNDPKSKDQFFKALKLYEHIVEYYPENEYKVIRAKAAIGGLYLNLDKDVEGCVLEYIDIFAINVEEIVDSTDERRNQPLAEAAGRTQAQLDFERYYKDHKRARTIELCSRPHKPELYALLDEIIERCAKTDPKIVEMAKAAKAEIEK